MSADAEPLLAGIEAGGTKFVLAVARSATEILARHEIPTLTPGETLAQAAQWFAAQGKISAIGIATFGPAQVDPHCDKWGCILDTPKPGWSDCDLAGYFGEKFGVPVGFDTDVNGAALAEYRLGAGQGTSGMAYVTVGTGIGGGLVVNGEVVHGTSHPEMGHFFPRRTPEDHAFAGVCPFHGDCLEGLASGPAILARWGKTLSDLPSDHEAHELVASYLAQLCHTLFACCAIERVIIGGGVANTPGLIDRIGEKVAAIGAEYLPGRKRHSVAQPFHLGDAGVVGAILLARGTSN